MTNPKQSLLTPATLKLIVILCFQLICCGRSPSRSIQSELPRVAAPLGPEEVTLPHSDPVPAAQVELAKPWIEVCVETKSQF